ncbi:hypothetical protein KEM54_004873 [Ascosphaera aggregata]|nr:hypothetical protein KEM54_004873 [Ascosphaera aggregata]
MPTFKAPGSDSPPSSVVGNGPDLVSNHSSAPSGGLASKEKNLLAKPSSGNREPQAAVSPSLFGDSVNSSTSLDDLLTWPGSAKKPAAQRNTGPSLLSQPPSQNKKKSSVVTGNNLLGTTSAKSLLFGADRSNLTFGNDNITPYNGPSMPDFGKSVFSGTAQGPDLPVKQVPTFHHENNLHSKVEERKALSQQPDKSETPKRKVVPRERESPLPEVVRNLVADMPVAEINEPSSLIAKTEDAISRLYESLSGNDITDEKAEDILSVAVNNLVTLWDKSLPQGKETKYLGSVGPGLRSSDFEKANFLASLLLPLCHPPVSKEEETSRDSYTRRVPFQSFAHEVSSDKKESIPKILLDWLNRHHPAHPEITGALRSVRPNPTASLDFWTTLNYLVLRADFSHAIALLEDADFSVARSALEDGYETAGYRGQQLQNVQKVVNTAVRNLRASPANGNNWDIKGMDWSIYRKQIQGAIGDLDGLVELRRYSPGTTRFSARLGLPNQQGTGVTFTHAARMADTQLPLTVYQRLKTMYSIILGDVEAVLENAQDWVEATIGLTCWWDGEDDTECMQQQGLSSFTRLVDENPRGAYLRRFACAFATATTEASDIGKEASFQINSFAI